MPEDGTWDLTGRLKG